MLAGNKFHDERKYPGAVSNSLDVLAVLCRMPVASRADLVSMTGLSPATISRAVAHLRREGLVRERTVPGRGVGRPPTVVQLEPEAASVLGIDAGGSRIRVLLTDLEGRVQARATRVLRATKRVDTVVRTIADVVRSVTDRAPGRVVAGAAGISGIVEHDAGQVLLSPDLPGLNGKPVAALLSDQLGIPVTVDNDDLLAAVGEAAFGAAQGCADVVFLSLGHGLGAGLIVDGHPVRGARSSAGAIAYLAPGRLEDRASGRAIPSRFLERRAVRESAPTAVTAERVFELAHGGDRDATAVVDEAVDALGDAVIDVAALLDPDIVVLGGGLVAEVGLVERLQRRVSSALPFPPRLVSSVLGEDAVARGAASVALAHAQRALAGVPTTTDLTNRSTA
jgi:predicted NBD/HSP70 family sugar kinase